MQSAYPVTKQHWLKFLWQGPKNSSTALGIFFTAFGIQVAGTLAGVHYFPGNYDWPYRVISSLASQIDNPEGHVFFAGSIGISFAMVFCLAGFLDARLYRDASGLSYAAGLCFRGGALGGFAVGVERGLLRNVSSMLHKSHEVIAFFAFSGIFLGILGFAATWCRGEWKQRRYVNALLLLILIVGPFAGAVASLLTIYVKYRFLGWVNPSWRALGVPKYLSFAFWQWFASVAAFVSMGILCFLAAAKSDPNARKDQRKLGHQS